MARPITFPEQIQARLAPGKIAAVQCHQETAETISDLWRRVIDEWLEMADRRRNQPEQGT
jgi:hypothetical protein